MGLSKQTPNQPIEYQRVTDFMGPDQTLANKLWDDVGIQVELGYVALDNSMIESKGLPRGMPFPWDHSKSVYYLQGYHQLHCLVSQTR